MNYILVSEKSLNPFLSLERQIKIYIWNFFLNSRANCFTISDKFITDSGQVLFIYYFINTPIYFSKSFSLFFTLSLSFCLNPPFFHSFSLDIALSFSISLFFTLSFCLFLSFAIFLCFFLCVLYNSTCLSLYLYFTLSIFLYKE